CQHQPLDSACDDRNDCTDDLCNATTGCVHANLSGGACEDTNFCTPAGTCDRGDCVTAGSAPATVTSLEAKLKPGDGNDSFTALIELPLPDPAFDPTVTGMRVAIADELGDTVYLAELQLLGWKASANGKSFRFVDSQGPSGPAAGISSVGLRINSVAATARAKIKMRGAEIPQVAEQAQINVSLQFGDDPAAGACLTALRIPCQSRGAVLRCRS
ncbi:MAG: hypothetical protein HY899_17180, partial [Deltaproteobacteria bacterium]|nr:hypothetical protein [Deltaproteobacteria bacterium]